MKKSYGFRGIEGGVYKINLIKCNIMNTDREYNRGESNLGIVIREEL